jgi:hypothetical protein
MLTEKQWGLLDALADGEQSRQQLYADYVACWSQTATSTATLEDFLNDLSELHAGGLITFTDQMKPAALNPDSQPASPQLANLWVATTPRGEAEWGDAAYEPFWKAPASKPLKSVTFSPRVQSAVAALCFLLMGVSLWGFMQGTFSIAGDAQANLGMCLAPIRATLASARAPDDVLQELDRAGRPNIWQSEAVNHLVRVDQALDTLAGAKEKIHAKLQLLINACRLYQNCGCGVIK